MQKSLSTTIYEIDSLPDSARIDMHDAYRNVFEEFRSANRLVDNVVEGNTTFLEEYRELREIYGGDFRLTPTFLSEEDRER